MYCEVFIFDAPYHIDRPFDYLCDGDILPGSIVRVPFGRTNNLRWAVVIGLKEKSDSENIKSIHSVLGSEYCLSEEMLSCAKDICYDTGINDILWLCQDMRELELYGTVDACVCCLDSVNYLTKLINKE